MDELMERLERFTEPEQLAPVVDQIRVARVGNAESVDALRAWCGRVGLTYEPWMGAAVWRGPREEE